jgi:hypothetical protein
MKTLNITALVVALCAATYIGGCSYRNIDSIKDAAPKTLDAAGFEIVGYAGYEIGNFVGNPGGRVWYIMRRKGNDRILYSGFISKWGSEYHIYNIKAKDAIAP